MGNNFCILGDAWRSFSNSIDSFLREYNRILHRETHEDYDGFLEADDQADFEPIDIRQFLLND